jgi:hypothetical protein
MEVGGHAGKDKKKGKRVSGANARRNKGKEYKPETGQIAGAVT